MYQCSKSKSNICQHTYIVNIPLSRDRAKCAGPLLDSFSCDFTEHNIGGFVNQPIDDPELAAKENRIDWKQYDVKTSSIVGDTSANKLDKTNGKPRDTPLVFPKTDHSNGIDNHGRYMSLNGSFYGDVNNAGRIGVLESRRFDTKVGTQCLEIWSNIRSQNSNSEITIEIWEADNRYGEIIGRFPLETKTISADIARDGEWNINRWNLQAPKMFKVIIRATLGSNDDVVVIDDISILDRKCESHRWPIHNFADVYEKTQHGEYIESEKMTASTGHIFVLRFYPRGHPNRGDEDYASLFLHLHSDSNNKDLHWPWDKQFLKYVAQDQVPDVLFRMDQNRIRATEANETSGEWYQVDDADDSGASKAKSVIGYETFIPTFDIFESSYSYVKHDTFMIFVDVRDLSQLDTSSKLSSCDGTGLTEPDRCKGEGLACLPKDGTYECQCHHPFVMNQEGGCDCPPG